MLEKAKEFLLEVNAEIKRITWPSRKEAVGGTIVVIAVVFLVSIYLGLIDSVLAGIVRRII
ncbi:MAG: preprotein translocase subunit SecE [Nitrospinae bacterium RIFCSPLOWO2_12_FULL_47_7]|nr:MAG: preprotein translocase subunit SecE [Nitrospinae bacterium RIFCSPLOWO2_12_FULL_47_7]